MHRDPKHDAQIAEDAGLTAEASVAPSVAKPDVGDKGIEAAIAQQKQNDKVEAGKEAAKSPPPAPKPSLDRLDKERAASEGMAPPSSP